MKPANNSAAATAATAARHITARQTPVFSWRDSSLLRWLRQALQSSVPIMIWEKCNKVVA